MKYPFYQVDVFTHHPFGGNPLAVFMDAKGLSNETMQKIAKEMNLSETSFILPPGDLPADFSIRIFTPEKELPFAGHPTLGTAHVLREAGKIPSGDCLIKLAMKAGIINVTQKEKENILFMTQPLPEFQLPLNCDKEISEVLGIQKSSINSIFCPIQIVSTGLPTLIVPIISLDALKKIVVDTHRLKQILATLNIDMVYAFTQQTVHSSASIHSRAFAPGLGISEDPATGSAAGALGAYLYKNNVISENACKKIYIEQGYQIGRPATLQVEVEQENNEIKSIRVGGESVTIIEGWINI